mmetsp:Transcript_9146/g.13274  ORF Transcript_9146/g.13274 Transcript_9146/m.13274 type:complete len:86 (+) Transcript_9146:281-538(+)
MGVLYENPKKSLFSVVSEEEDFGAGMLIGAEAGAGAVLKPSIPPKSSPNGSLAGAGAARNEFDEAGFECEGEDTVLDQLSSSESP